MMIDRLEPRLQFATLSGQLFNDADRSLTYDAGETPFVGQTVFIDANQNGELDGGEQTTTTDEDGRYTFTGLADGEYTIGTTVSNDDYTSTTATSDGTKKGSFDIKLNGVDSIVDPKVRAAFELAKIRWESIITGDVEDYTSPAGVYYDDVTINVTIGAIDGASSILGYAQPLGLRDGSNIAYLGEMRFDSADMGSLIEDGTLNDVILHEMGHVLGIGSTWKADALMVGSNSKQPRYIGDNAVREYNDLFGTDGLSIPIENTFGQGTYGVHWRESVLRNELMTGILGDNQYGSGLDDDGNPIINPLSRITVGALEDAGYEVNYDAADTWDPTTLVATKAVGTDYGAVARERTITLGSNDVTDLDFGYIAATRPVIHAFNATPNPITPGFPLILTATGITDTDQDALSNVSFWQETNGIEGLQRDSDTRLGNKTISKAGAFKIQVPTTGLSGSVTYYAVATDAEGRSGRRTGVVEVGETTLPDTTPHDLAVSRVSSTSVQLTFADEETGLSGFRVEIASASSFKGNSLFKAFNLDPNTTSVDIIGLTPGQKYYVRVRSFNNVGASPYSEYSSFELV
ncbi:MAG: fibronectin type III domain-containing protein [Tepidisphaeraceae bacterium]